MTGGRCFQELMASTGTGLRWFDSAIYNSRLAVALLAGLSMNCGTTRRESNRRVKNIEHTSELTIKA